MPNTFIENRDRWLLLSEIDYLGQFVKAWLAFNAWYRSAYNESQDRAIIQEIKWQSNPVLSKLRPLMTRDSEDAQQFKSEIGLLHFRLEGFELHTGKGDEKLRITLTNVFLKTMPPVRKTGMSYGSSFAVERRPDTQVQTVVTNRTGTVVFNHHQPKFNLAELEAQPSFVNRLSPALQSFLRQLYKQVDPQWYADLTQGTESPVRCGAYDFSCGRDALFAGVLEAIYLMRNTLFHGELIPTKEATACYEPAYRLVRRCLECVS